MLTKSNDNFFEYYFDNKIITYISIGSKRQTIPLYININTPYTYLAGKNSKVINGEQRYNEKESNTFHNGSSKNDYNSNTLQAVGAKDEININDNITMMLKLKIIINTI